MKILLLFSLKFSIIYSNYIFFRELNQLTKKEFKEFWESKSLGEIKGVYLERLTVCENGKYLIKLEAEKIVGLDVNGKNYISRLKDSADTIKRYAKSTEEDLKILEQLKPILDKKEAEGLDQAEYEKYMENNKDNILPLIQKVKEMENIALTTWKDKEGNLIPKEDIKYTHDFMLKELIFMIKGNVGNVESIVRLEYNANKGFDGTIKGERGTVNINTIIAGGYNVQKLHYRTLIYKY